MKYVRVSAGPDDESHFEDVSVELAPVTEHAQGIPTVYLSALGNHLSAESKVDPTPPARHSPARGPDQQLAGATL